MGLHKLAVVVAAVELYKSVAVVAVWMVEQLWSVEYNK
jgi:hypothetical protein